MIYEQWLKVDSYFFAKPFTMKVAERYGAAGVVAWMGFLAACKRNPTQGRITFASEPELHQLLFLGLDVRLVDNQGKPWDLECFFTFTRRHHQTRRTSRGRMINEHATDWKRWQNEQKTDEKRAKDADRKRRSRAISDADKKRTENEKENEKENESVTPHSLPSGSGATQEPTARPYPDWEPEHGPPEPTVNLAEKLAEMRRQKNVDG